MHFDDHFGKYEKWAFQSSAAWNAPSTLITFFSILDTQIWIFNHLINHYRQHRDVSAAMGQFFVELDDVSFTNLNNSESNEQNQKKSSFWAFQLRGTKWKNNRFDFLKIRTPLAHTVPLFFIYLYKYLFKFIISVQYACLIQKYAHYH